MMHDWLNNKFLAARGDKEWLDILFPLAIAAVYAIVSLLRKKGENQQGGGEEKPRSRSVDQTARQKPSRQGTYQAQENPAAVRQAAQREFDEAKEIARRQYDARMERIAEYEVNKPEGVSDEVWKRQIENARKTVQNEYEEAQQTAREEYQRVISRLPATAPQPVRQAPKPQPAPQPVRQTYKPQPSPQPVAARPTVPQPSSEPSQPLPAAQSRGARQVEAADAMAYNLKFTRDDLTKGFLYSEILGKPLALRDDA